MRANYLQLFQHNEGRYKMNEPYIKLILCVYLEEPNEAESTRKLFCKNVESRIHQLEGRFPTYKMGSEENM